jgi:ribosome assembly protein YihI (activator of Der GTPase)
MQRFIMPQPQPEDLAQAILTQFLDRLDDARGSGQYSVRFVDRKIDSLTRLLHQALGTSPLQTFARGGSRAESADEFASKFLQKAGLPKISYR